MKKLYIPDNYFGYSQTQAVMEIAKPLYENCPIDFFDFTRAYYDCSWMFLTCHPEMYQFCINAGSIFLPNADIKKSQSFHYLAGNDRTESMMADVKRHFQIDNVFAYVDKQDKYIDVYWYGS